MAAYGIVANLSLVVSSIYTGIAQGTQPIFSRFYGYGDLGGIKKTLKYAIRSMFSTCFTSVERALPAQIVSLSRGGAVIIPMAFFMSILFKMTGVWLSYPLTEGIVAMLGLLLYKKLRTDAG